MIVSVTGVRVFLHCFKYVVRTSYAGHAVCRENPRKFTFFFKELLLNLVAAAAVTLIMYLVRKLSAIVNL